MTERKSKRKVDETNTARTGRVRAVADMLPDIGGVAFRRFGFAQTSIVSRWPEIVGARYADVSTPESLRFPTGKRSDGVLHLMVDSAHAPMMQHVAPAIVERVNRFFGYTAVARLMIRQGSLPPAAPKKSKMQEHGPVPVELGESLRAITDPDLRECLSALAGAVVANTTNGKLPRIS